MMNRSFSRALRVAAVVWLMAGSAASLQAQEAAMNTLTDAEREAGWQLLFDGTTLNGWRGYMMDTMPEGWDVVDGAIVRTGPTRDIITNETFRDFELFVDWKIDPGGNSGIFYRAIEGPEEIYHGAPEMQVLDDAAHADGASPLTASGANYALHPAPSGVVKPAGEWNTARLIVDGNHVEHWLNGEKLLEYEFGSEDWQRRVAESKFAEWPEYGMAAEGHIGLQEHGNGVAFRNIKIRVIR